jgi:hypothetical protein
MSKLKSFYSVIAISAALCAFGAEAQAKVYSIPSEDAVATINIPDDWKPNEIEMGVEMNSPDSGIYVDVEAVNASDVTAAVAETFKLLAKQGLVIDEKSSHQTDSEKNGLKMHDFTFTGTDNDGPTNFSITMIETNVADKYLMLTFWGSDEAAKANGKALSDMADSVQLTK